MFASCHAGPPLVRAAECAKHRQANDPGKTHAPTTVRATMQAPAPLRAALQEWCVRDAASGGAGGPAAVEALHSARLTLVHSGTLAARPPTTTTARVNPALSGAKWPWCSVK